MITGACILRRSTNGERETEIKRGSKKPLAASLFLFATLEIGVFLFEFVNIQYFALILVKSNYPFKYRVGSFLLRNC